MKFWKVKTHSEARLPLRVSPVRKVRSRKIPQPAQAARRRVIRHSSALR